MKKSLPLSVSFVSRFPNCLAIYHFQSIKNTEEYVFFQILGAQAPLRPSVEQISILTMENVNSSKNDERVSPGGFFIEQKYHLKVKEGFPDSTEALNTVALSKAFLYTVWHK